MKMCKSFIVTYFSPSKSKEQSVPLKPSSQSHVVPSELQLPWLSQDERSRQTNSGHIPFCNGTSPGQLDLA